MTEKEASPPPGDVDSDPSEEIPLAAARVTSASSKPPDVQPTVEAVPPIPPPPDTPPPANPPQNSAHKKSARSAKKAKGRNQYTRDRDRDDSERSPPIRSLSRDTPRADEANGGNARAERHNAKPARNTVQSKISMNELKRRSAAFLEFIGKTQVELASEDLAEHGPSNPGSRSASSGSPGAPLVNGGSLGVDAGEAEEAMSPGAPEAVFKDMNCVAMMDLLTRDLVKWQNRYTA
ncbi:MAG: hypothetical protein IMZ46_19495 [Acidobacteria bacterium]|nr:hypothetical protein [Acidobacteriota bacterium]